MIGQDEKDYMRSLLHGDVLVILDDRVHGGDLSLTFSCSKMEGSEVMD